MRRLTALCFLCVLFFSCGSSASSDTKLVKKAIDAFTDFYAEKDPKLLKGLFTSEPAAIVYGISNEVWKGEETIRKKMEKTMDDVEDSNIDVRDQVIKINGNVAWFSQRGDWNYDYKGQRVQLEGVRMTGVLIYEGGKWQIAQLHSSYPVRAAQQQ
ncbi:MAG: DUF4440 domain-containing protein [Chitinophagaceae bacterium]|nr:MAG: DUF4440 domain-containing protein [Chitinophagaceae bacterium]